jgi:hypothetical protein
VRVENGIHYGDTIDHVDFAYLAKMTKLNAAALAAIARAPPPPEPKVEGAVSTDTTVTWPRIPGVRSYKVRWRRTDSNQWQVSRIASHPEECPLGHHGTPNASDAPTVVEPIIFADCKVVLPHIRVDDWVFGVSSVGANGFESPVASAVPGGAFKPYVPPPTTK